jgi:hypothetical protein
MKMLEKEDKNKKGTILGFRKLLQRSLNWLPRGSQNDSILSFIKSIIFCHFTSRIPKFGHELDRF